MRKNDKVPSAILSCFLIAFILQGILKICGIFVFEKALTWDIFTLIDTNKILYVINYFFIVFIVVYCLSFALTANWYSKKWYHYPIMILPTLAVIIAKTIVIMPVKLQFVCDILLYVIVPLIVYFTTNKKDRLFGDVSVSSVVAVISIQISLYFCYLGLTYWSVLLNSLIPSLQIYTKSSTTFLIFFEVYMAEILMMLSCNLMTRKLKNKEN